MSNTNNSALYGRVSTDKQETAPQEIRCKEYLTWKHLTLAGEYYDDDTSGSIPMWERPRGKELGQRLQAGDIQHLVVLKLDRLGRSAMDLLNTVQYLDTIHVTLHIVDLGGDSLSTQGASGRLMFTVLAGMAEYERELIRSRITQKLELKRSKGEVIGTVPYGWEAEDTGELSPKGVKLRRLIDNPVEQQRILVMVQMRQQGKGYHTIAKYLNSHGVPTKRRGEVLNLRHSVSVQSDTRFPTGKWQSGNVAHVLENQTVQAWLRTRNLSVAA